MPDTANLQDFAGRVAIVTGASRGLGLAAAARLHERGASVVINARDRHRSETGGCDETEKNRGHKSEAKTGP